MINDEVKDVLIEELKTINLSKFVSEAVSYICAAKLRSTDIQAAVQVCAVLTVPKFCLLSLISSQHLIHLVSYSFAHYTFIYEVYFIHGLAMCCV